MEKHSETQIEIVTKKQNKKETNDSSTATWLGRPNKMEVGAHQNTKWIDKQTESDTITFSATQNAYTIADEEEEGDNQS